MNNPITGDFYCGQWPTSWARDFSVDSNMYLRAVVHVDKHFAIHGGPLRCLPKLSRGWLMLASTNRLLGQVCNGGFQSLWYYDPWTVRPTIEGFRLIGAEKISLLMETVYSACDWSGESNANLRGCDLTDSDASIFEQRFDELINSSVPGSYDVGALTNAYMLSHQYEFRPLW